MKYATLVAWALDFCREIEDLPDEQREAVMEKMGEKARNEYEGLRQSIDDLGLDPYHYLKYGRPE